MNQERTMAKSPGHEKWPQHQIRETPIDGQVTVRLGDETLADSWHAVRVDEDGHPTRHYFPRDDVRMELMSRSETTTRCPFKGEARYYHLAINGRKFEDAAWSYEEPYDEHLGLKELVAFEKDKIPGLRIEPPAQ
jgi:uncharacterized protein (DUF427 family)